MTPQPTTPKRIEKLDWIPVDDGSFDDIAYHLFHITRKLNEIIDRLHTIEDEKNKYI